MIMGKDRQWLMAYETLRDADLPNAPLLEFRSWVTHSATYCICKALPVENDR